LCSAVLTVISVFCAAQAWAGVVASPHDISAQKYTVLGREEEKKNVCNYCHVPHKAKGARLWPTAPPSLKGWGKVGPLCYSCHDGIAIVSPYVDASNTAFNPKSHGLDLNMIPQGDNASQSGLPYTEGNENFRMECSTCHNPHDNTNRPFLRVTINEICLKCHQNRENSGYAINNVEGTHPVHKQPLDEVEGASPIEVIDQFKVAFPQPYPSENGKYADSSHWTLGGHLSSGREGTIECTTCHSIHGMEFVGPDNDNLLTVNPVDESADLFCEGCHRGVRGDKLASPSFPNPGGTIKPRTYHPADNDISNGTGNIVPTVSPEGWPRGKGGEILCTTCHKAHGAMKNSPILRPTTASQTFCEECHSAPFAHHPSGGSAMGSRINSGKPYSKTRNVTIPTDFPAGISYGDAAPGKVYCSTCHRAHNANCQPILVNDCADGDSCSICTTCHPKFNPTWQTDDNHKATHFMGDPTASIIDKVTVNGSVFGTQPGYREQYPPVNTEVWPESRALSKYGGAEGKDITCCSCHSFTTGSLVGGDADQSPYSDGPLVAPNFQPEDLTYGLIARAGSFKEWLESDVFQYVLGGDRGTITKVDKYLCTGCHGLTPNTHPGMNVQGEGMSHPMMGVKAGSVSATEPAKMTYNKKVNCESCHSAHEADSRGGFLILRLVAPFGGRLAAGAAADPYSIKKRSDIEFAPLCKLCHTNY
jgi:predicted CXXCH cytochrome family protein